MAIEEGRPYLSIGEVLNVLKDDFDDITVSKIRFLESEGLIEPERTSSGYRKFSDNDIQRLGYILRLQRDHFLPLKVIRERLDEMQAQSEAGGGQSTLSFDAAAELAEEADAAPQGEQPPTPSADAGLLSAMTTGVSLSADELCRASGLDAAVLRELESVGVLRAMRSDDDTKQFDEFALEAAKLCHELVELGLEPRHIRMFRSHSDRWAGLAEQMVNPLVRQRNPDARKAASDTVREFTRVGNKLVQTMLRESLRSYTP